MLLYRVYRIFELMAHSIQTDYCFVNTRGHIVEDDYHYKIRLKMASKMMYSSILLLIGDKIFDK
jgi:hypothetical protein